jgi:hypothetical protein
MQVRELRGDEIRTEARQALCELLIDAVSGGASVGWVAVPSNLEASTYWDSVALPLGAPYCQRSAAGLPKQDPFDRR